VQQAMEPLRTGDPEPTRPVPSTPPRSSNGSAQGYPQGRGPQRPLPPSTRDRGESPDRAASPASEFGSIALRVQPDDATITIDGQRWERAQDQDRLEVRLGVGIHTVEIRKDGYRTYITDINVQPGETTPLNVSLNRQ
jgi:hypothetical protein